MSIRFAYFVGFAVITALLLFSIYLQYAEGVIPCPLCSMQRLIFAMLGVFFLIGTVVHSKFWARMLINTLCSLFSLIGIVLAGRQIWLQHLPGAEGNECGVSLQYMLEALPLNEALQKILQGSAECSRRGWEFLHLNMAEWALICFFLCLIGTFYLFMKEVKWKHRH